MRYSKVFVDSIGYELAPVVVSSEEIEERLAPLYHKLHIPEGQVEELTGIEERRWWEEGHRLSDGAIAAAKKAMKSSNVPKDQIQAVIYTGVGRENFEPATACRVASALDVSPHCAVHDISNACLGMINGMMDIANRIQLGQIKAGLVVSCETARRIVEQAISLMLDEMSMEYFISSLATLTGGSGAAAVLLTDGSWGKNRQLLGGWHQSAPEHHGLCRWGMDSIGEKKFKEVMETDAPSVMKYGVELGVATWANFLQEMEWNKEEVDRLICHQVGEANRDSFLKAIHMPEEKDFITYPFLGNMGTVSLPLSAALAEERGFLAPGHRVGFLGIGSGLNCMMLGLEW